MSFSFDPNQGLIIVPSEILGPGGSAVVRLAFDTGATSSLINAGILAALRYDPALSPDRIQVTTGSGVEFAPRVTLKRIVALGLSREAFPVLCHTLPPSAGINGLLGLDFIRGWTITIDCRLGRLELTT